MRTPVGDNFFRWSAAIFDRWFRTKPAPLTGAPAIRRQKSYSALSGFVYQYYYQGQRPSPRDRGTEFVFEVSADRKTSAPVSVFVSDEAVENWQRERGRLLSSTERYAIAKLALFQAFDERQNPGLMREQVRVRTADVESILGTLDID